MSATVVQNPSTAGMSNNAGATTGVSNSISAMTAGNTLLLAIMVPSGAPTVNSVAGFGATWTLIVSITDSVGTCGKLAFWQGTGGSGSGTATATFSSSTGSSIALFEISSYGSLDFSSENTTNTSGVTASTTASLTVNPVTAGDLLFTLIRGQATLSAPTWAGHTDDGGATGVQWMTDATTASETSTWTQASSTVYMILAIGLIGAQAASIPNVTMAPMRGN